MRSEMQFEWKHIVEWGECDPARIVFYPNVYRWFDKSSLDLMKHHGFGQDEMIDALGIVGYPLIETHAEFKSPMKWTDELLVSSSVSANSAKTFKIIHKVFRGEELCVEGYEIRCWGKRDAETGKMSAINIPEEFLAVI